MKIGVFDSGLGGLVILQAIRQALPQYSYYYLGDTLNLPYGEKTSQEIFRLLQKNLRYLFAQECRMVIIACNTASAEALRKIQQDWLPAHFPDRTVLGVLVPAAEAAVKTGAQRIGILATPRTVASQAFGREITKLNPKIRIVEVAAKGLTQAIENANNERVGELIKLYTEPFLASQCQVVILGCTHYGLALDQIQSALGPSIKVISEEEVIGSSLQDYLHRHPELENSLNKKTGIQLSVTQPSTIFNQQAEAILGQPYPVELVTIS